eukprot:5793148-Pyramimonas_sp.AAC.1
MAAPQGAEPAWASGLRSRAIEVSWSEGPRASLAPENCSREPRDLPSQSCAEIYKVSLHERPGSSSSSSSSSAAASPN